ncbi:MULTISPECIES: carbon-nitrogen hydrolase family protein [Campylobacter]|uniref:Carbon-nitrogen hydrolase family protein n=1 Tax=Campylobacter porcelli TaxID=1660073 RepID=A0A1X9SXG9_9BACT|nr:MULTISPECIES: carbon-nitrogen hydrolase family protein [unclassified Campylobacter]ARR00957.1 hydrolase, carbon-nitrogen family [Campylobacter sp. RM6137]MCR8696139.1 carbon-nitrogen hydrolase family protein [Campylobacter sp. RM19073]MEE3744440.1 carbon-nitrogen hydrolase family protein [Campylobacter sp. CX2-4855-23]
MSRVAALQLHTLAMSDSRIDHYLSLAAKGGASVVVLGEYVINSFFNDIIKMPKSMIKEQSEQKKSSLLAMANRYNLTIIAPLLQVKGKECKKVVAKFSPQSTKYEEQNILIDYPHWNEAKFYSKKESFGIMSFSVDRIKFGVIFGFEAHFDRIWAEIVAKKIDCVLLPSACALNSSSRWNELLKMRAFTNNVYIVRVNRLGKTKFDDIESEFYGQSMLINPHGEIENSLDSNEGMLMCDIDKKLILQARSIWKFRQKAEALLGLNI